MAAIVTVKVPSRPKEIESPDAAFDPLSEFTDTQIELWTSVEAVLVAPGIYRLVGEISEDDELQFKTGDVVRCEEREWPGLTAIELFT